MDVRLTVVALGAFLAAGPAFAASDVTVNVSAPTGVPVYSVTPYSVLVKNIGNQNASNVTVSVALPATHNSPTAYIMGTLSGVDSRCTRTGTTLNCALGTLKRGKQTTVTFGLALPQSAAPIVVSAHGATTSSENTLPNTHDSDTASQSFYATVIDDGDAAVNRHCTGTLLTAFLECEYSPSSISSHDSIYYGDGTISFPEDPSGYYAGEWELSGDHLVMTYTENGTVTGDFDGRGVGGDCFEGLMIWVGGSYVSPYEICLQ